MPEHTDVQLKDEFDAIKQWAAVNKMVLNMLKTKEIVLHRPSPRRSSFPRPIDGIEIAREAKLIGMHFSDTLSVASHVNFVLRNCAQRVHLIKQLRAQGLSADNLTIIFNSLIISKIMYAAPAYSGLFSAHDKLRIASFLKIMFRYGITSKLYNIDTLFVDADSVLF